MALFGTHVSTSGHTGKVSSSSCLVLDSMFFSHIPVSRILLVKSSISEEVDCILRLNFTLVFSGHTRSVMA